MPNPVYGANFTYVSTALAVSFTDTSSSTNPPITAWLWTFGDGTTSTAQSPAHTYATAGTYTVSLQTTDGNGLSTVSLAISVTAGGSASGTTTGASEPTYTLKGFVDFGAWANNSPSLVSNLGELSVYSQTYAKDRQLFGGSTSGSTPTSVNLTVFASDDATLADQIVPPDYATALLGMASWIYAGALAGQFSADASIFQQAFVQQYSSVVKNVSVGVMAKLNGTTNVWAPTSLEFFFAAASQTAPAFTANSRIRLWFSDQTFQAQFDEYDIEFLPPLANLDIFFQSAASIQTALGQVLLTDTMKGIALLRGTDPETVLDTKLFYWTDPTNAQNTIPTSWTYLIYGLAGNNTDAIKSALRAYILANSTHPQSDWQTIFPDIFSSTEFILTPLWSQTAIPNLTLSSGVYSPVVNANQATNVAIETAAGTGYTAQFVGNYANVVPVPFKSMAMTAIGNPNNRGGIFEFAKRWPDYINVSSTSLDFDRMQPNTQGFCTLLGQMLNVAEGMTIGSDLPVGMTRILRPDATGNPILYLVATYNDVDYLMVSKNWMVSKYGLNTNTNGSVAIVYNGIFANGAYQLLNQDTTMTIQFTAANATAPYNYQIMDTTVTTATINPSSGLFTGTFPAEGPYTVTLKLTDVNGKAVQRTFAFYYQQPSSQGGATAPPLVLGSLNAPSGKVGQSYAGSIAISGGSSPYALDGPQTIPAGLAVTISGSTVVLGGTPTASGQSVFILHFKDSTSGSPKTVSTQFTVTIDP